jgi:hypothetical protein
MVPFLAPLLGSMAASLLPASIGTGIAGTLGLSGAAGGLIAAAAPKALGAGIGTLLAGGDLGDAAMNAVGFGAGSTALGAMMGGGASAAGTTGAGAAAAAPASQPMDAIKAIAQTLQGGGQSQPQAAPRREMEKPDARTTRAGMGQARLPVMPGQPPSDQGSFEPMTAVNQIASTTVPTGGSSMMPAAVGIGSLPGMNNDTMLASFSPDQRNMINGHLGSQGVIGFA